MVRLTIKYFSPDQLKKILEVEKLLHNLGIEFDTGNGRNYRDWEFDFSLKGAVSTCSCGYSNIIHQKELENEKRMKK